MDPTTPGPWSRPIGRPTGFEDRPSPADADIPWIDIHQHTQSLTWNDRETFDLSGGRAAVMIAAGYYWTPYRPITPDDIRFLWDDALRRAETFRRNHFYDQYVAVGVHTWARVEAVEDLLAVLPDYCELDEVVAIGETGIESTQHTSAWDLDGQRDVVREQCHIARETGLPILLHTPGSSKGDMPAWFADRYEEANESFTDSTLDPDTAKRDAVDIDLEVAEEAGLPQEQMVIDHAGPEIAPRVLEETGCHLAFTVGAEWLRGVTAGDVADVIETYGPDRILLDTDLFGAMRTDPFAMRRTIMALLQLGIDPGDVRQVVYENPRDLLGLSV